MANYDFFQHKSCEYFPCHKGADPETFSCLFCYCPLYPLGDACGGNFTYTADGLKDCSGFNALPKAVTISPLKSGLTNKFVL